MSFSVLYSSNIVCITPPRFDAMLSEKSGRGFSRFYFHSMKASAEERGLGSCFSFLPLKRTYTRTEISINSTFFRGF